MQALSITINGENNGSIESESTDDINLLKISTTTPVTIKNLKIDGGQYASCGIYAGCRVLTIENGVEITDNTQHGVFSADTVIMNGGKICNNGSLSTNGGGIDMITGKFIMRGGLISGNKAQNGGGIYAENISVKEIIIDGGTISGTVTTT